MRDPISQVIALASFLFLAVNVEAQKASLTINTNFEDASIGKIERPAEDVLRCHVAGQSDERGRNRQANWYYFRLDGTKDREITLILTNFVGEYNDKPGA